MKLRGKTIGMAAILCCTLAGCGATSRSVRYGDPGRVETLTADWGSTDLQSTAERMVSSLLRHPVVSGGSRPVVQVSTVKNSTTESVDTKAVTDKIRTALVKSGMVRMTGVSDAGREILENLQYQTSSGVVRKDTAKTPGNQIGADYLLVGEVSSIVKSGDSARDVYYKFTLNLVDVSSGIIEWSDEKEIRKES